MPNTSDRIVNFLIAAVYGNIQRAEKEICCQCCLNSDIFDCILNFSVDFFEPWLLFSLSLYSRSTYNQYIFV